VRGEPTREPLLLGPCEGKRDVAFVRCRSEHSRHLRRASEIARRRLVDNDLRDIVGRQLPLRTRALVATKVRIHRTGHHIRNADSVVPDLLHQRFAECVQTGL